MLITILSNLHVTTHIHKSLHVFAHTLTYIHTRSCTHTHTYIHPCIHIRVHIISIHAHTHTDQKHNSISFKHTKVVQKVLSFPQKNLFVVAAYY